MWTGLSTYLFCSCNHSNDRTHAELKTSSYSSGEGRSWHCVIAPIDLLRNISAHLQRRCSSRSHLLHSSWTFLAASSSSAVISSPSSSVTFQSIPKCVLSLQIHDSLSVFLPDFDSFFLASTLWCSFSLIFPSTIILQFRRNLWPSLSHIVSPPLDLSGLSAFIHFKLQLMMNESNIPWAQTWVALWDSSQLPKGSSGLIPYSWAASTPVLVLCISRDPSLSWHLKVNFFFFSPQKISPLFSKQHGAMSELFLWNFITNLRQWYLPSCLLDGVLS